MLQFCKDILSDADIGHGQLRVGALTYGSDAKIMFHLKQFSRKEDVFDAIDEIPFLYGGKNTAEALRLARTEMFTVIKGDRPKADDVIMLITDGISDVNEQFTILEADAAKSDGIHIFTIGIGLEDYTELNAIATSPASENSFLLSKFEELFSLAENLFISTCPGLCVQSSLSLLLIKLSYSCI